MRLATMGTLSLKLKRVRMKNKDWDPAHFVAGIDIGYRMSSGCSITFRCFACKGYKNVIGRKPVLSAITGKRIGYRCAQCVAEKAARLKGNTSGR